MTGGGPWSRERLTLRVCGVGFMFTIGIDFWCRWAEVDGDDDEGEATDGFAGGDADHGVLSGSDEGEESSQELQLQEEEE